MLKNNLLASLISASAVLAFSGTAQAASITYTFSGIGNGSIGATPFTNTAFTFTETTNTSEITYNNPVWSAPLANLGVTVGANSGTTTGTYQFYDIPSGNIVGVSDDISNVNSQTFFHGQNSSISTYDLSTPIGPLTLNGLAVGTTFTSQGTSFGSLTISHINSGTFTATSAVAVPEPSNVLGVIGFGIFLGVSGLLKKRKSGKK